MIACAKEPFQSSCVFHLWEADATFTEMRSSPTFGSSSDDGGDVGLSLVVNLIPAVSTAWTYMLVLNQYFKNPIAFL